MDVRRNPIWLSFSIGRWFGTDVRVSFFFPILLVALCFRLGAELGCVVTCLLFASILIHEFAHVFAARFTGGSGDEILMWPLGGLAFVSPAGNFRSEAWTVLSGPLANALLCVATLPAVLSAELLRDSLTLLVLPISGLSDHWIRDLLILTFSLNFKLLMLNLLPVYPLDGGQFSYSVAKLYWDRQTARIGSLWGGMLVSFVVAAVGYMQESSDVVMIGLLLGMACQYQFFLAQAMRTFDVVMDDVDYFSGSNPFDEDSPPSLGPIARWKLARAEKKREREELERIETARRVDELLEKVHLHGMDSLSETERRFLERASSSYRKTGK